MSDLLIHAFLAFCDQATARAEDDAAFDPSLFRLELELELTKALAADAQGSAARTRAAERRSRREALRSRAALVVDEVKVPASVSILTEDWFSAAVDAEETQPDEADPELRQAAVLLARGADERTVERLTGYGVEDADAVPFRTQADVGRDEDDLAWLARDDAPAPRGFGMTANEERRKWLMDARLRYSELLTDALRYHRGRLSTEQVKRHKQLMSEVWYARNVLAKWAFVDELTRHPEGAKGKVETEQARNFKSLLGKTYAEANETLAERRRLAEAGKIDRYQHEFV